MTRSARWGAVALGVLLVVAVPVVIRALPSPQSALTARAVLAKVVAAEDRPWSGYVETRGSLELPVADGFADVGALLADRTRMRVWWRGPDEWRVDRLLVSGETDLVHGHGATIEWSYERGEARLGRDPDVRLPRTADLVPPTLAERVLRDVDPGAVTRIDDRRVAGIAAAGIRVRPAARQASVDHVDLWADPASGVPLRLAVYARRAQDPSFVSELRDFSAETPDASLTAFDAGPEVQVRYRDVLDIADAANQYAPVRPPAVVGGLGRTGASDGAVGVYGVGVTQLVAIPLRDREADALRDQLRLMPGVRSNPRGTLVAAGPLGLMMTGGAGAGWLLTGTVTEQTLEQAADDVARETPFAGTGR